MQTVLIVVHLIIVLALIAVVLLQRSEGGLGLGGGGGGGGVAGFMTGRGQANALTRATAILAALFFVTSMTLAVMSHRTAAPKSIFDAGAPAQGGKAAPTGSDNLLDTLRKAQDRTPETAPAQPAPAPAAPAGGVDSSGVPTAPQSR
jgi:preprotein translocase subunit SecG